MGNNQSGQLDLSVLKTALQYGVGDYKTGITRHVLAVCDRKQVHFCRHSQWLVATDRAKFAKFPLQKVEGLFKREEALSTDDNGKRISEKDMGDAAKKEVEILKKEFEAVKEECETLWDYIKQNVYHKRCDSIIPLLVIESTAKTLGLSMEGLPAKQPAKDETLKTCVSTPWHNALGVPTISLDKQVTPQEENNLPRVWARFMFA